MTLQDIVAHLIKEGYMQKLKSGYRVTAKFNAVMLGQETGLISLNGTPVVQEKAPPPVVLSRTVDWKKNFLELIRLAEIPAKGNGPNGTYDINQYSEQASKEFRRIVEKEGKDPVILAGCAKIYYKLTTYCPVKIGTYILDGVWRAEYDLLAAMTQEERQVHVAGKIRDNGGYTNRKTAWDR